MMKRYALFTIPLLAGALLLISTTRPARGQTEPLPTFTPSVGRLHQFMQAMATQAAMQAEAEAERQMEQLQDLIAQIDALPKFRAEDGAFNLGTPESPITIIEFSDWACSHCQNYREEIETVMFEAVANGEANFEYRIFPTAGGDQTVVAGLLAECVDEQIDGGFWHAHVTLYALALSGRYGGNLLDELSQHLSLDADVLDACAANADQVLIDVQYGRAAGVQGTPAVLVRYGSDDPTYITLDDQTYNRGGVPADVLREVIAAAQDAG